MCSGTIGCSRTRRRCSVRRGGAPGATGGFMWAAGRGGRCGLRTGRAVPLPEVVAPLALRGLIAVSALAAMALAFAMLVEAVGAPVPARLVWVVIGLGVLITVALFARGPRVPWLEVLALGTAASFPAPAIALAI